MQAEEPNELMGQHVTHAGGLPEAMMVARHQLRRTV
jgi:hypothetical protein